MKNRDYKFRAIHAESGTAFFTLNSIDGHGFIMMETGFQEVDNCHISQCTGLTDKNGVDIYEGDITRWPTGIATIVWDDACFAVESPGSQAVDYPHSSEFKTCEVIGNIYEHPELLR